MSLHYAQQRSYGLVGSKNVNTNAVSPATLSSTYSGNTKTIPVDYSPQAVIFVQYTPGAGGSGNYITIKIECSPDTANNYQETSELTTPGTTNTYLQERKFDNNGATVALTTYLIRIPFPLSDRLMKFSVKETKVGGSNGAIYAEALVSGK